MKPSLQTSELISALADGQLAGEDLAAVLQACGQDDSALACWGTYHLIGDALRSPASRALGADMAFLARLNQRLAVQPLDPLQSHMKSTRGTRSREPVSIHDKCFTGDMRDF